MKQLLIALVLSLSVVSTTASDHDPLAARSIIDNSFLKAKYFTELVYITKDKQLVREFKECFKNKTCYDAKFRPLRKWALLKNKDIVLETIDLFLNAKFEGK
jgi:hypothetical protein